MNPYNKQDLIAQQQAIRAIGDYYTVKRKFINKYDNYGRPLKKEIKETVFGVLTYSSKNLNLDSNGHGEWIPTSFSFTCVEPDYISIGDILETEFGQLKVISISDRTMFGNMSGTLQRIGSTPKIENEVI